MLAAIPLLIDHPKMEWFELTAPHARNEYAFAQNWILGNRTDVPRQLRLARAVMIFYFLLGAWTIYRWAFELYGSPAAWLALALWSLSPDVITYSATVAPDLPAAATGLFACYLFWKWLYGGRNQIPWEVCIGVALATLSKFSWLFLFLLFPLLTVLHDLLIRYACTNGQSIEFPPMANRWRFAWQRLGKLAIALLGTLLIINLVYGFDGTGRRLGEFEFLSTSLGGEHHSQLETGNRFRKSLIGNLPMPVPSDLLQGIDYLKWEFECGMPCYLLGEWKFRGWWYFYLVAMAVKIPIGYFVLMALGGFSMLASFLKYKPIRGEWLVPLVAVLFLAQVSCQTGFTHHLRYVLPAFGFLYLLAARSVLVLPKRLVAISVGSCLIGTVFFHATHLGQSHAHFNWLSGGLKNGWRHLSLSNVDWGQSTFRMADWVRSNSQLQPMTVVFVSNLGEPSQLVADLNVATAIGWRGHDGDHSKKNLPKAGWYLMSSEQLTHKENMYFRTAKPESWPYADVVLFYVPVDDN